MVLFDTTIVRELPELCEPWKADDVAEPRLVALNEAHARSLGFEVDWLRSPDGVRFLVGNHLLDGSEPAAQAYTGHQFGNLAPRLGDGRALLLGEVVDPDGRRHDVHLKGSGRTPFARGGDGKAVLGPMLREQLMCEAMHALGVPTTRALATVATGEDVRRETLLPGAVFVRTAASHLRIGTFQYAAMQGDSDLLERLLRYAARRHHPALDADGELPELAVEFLDRVMQVQIDLVAAWMSLGFVHGVLNTDNVTISGETIDYGPCAFMDAYHPATVYSSIDHGGRYAYGNQPSITQWNLARLAETLLPLMSDDTDVAIEIATGRLGEFPDRFTSAWRARLAAKLALDPDAAATPDLIDDWLRLLEADSVDWTSAFRSLSGSVGDDRTATRNLFVDLAGIDAWLARWTAQLDHDRVPALDDTNPVHIPRNHLVEEALTAATDGDLRPFERLVDVLTRPFEARAGLERYAEPAPADFGRYRTFCGT